MRAGSGFPGPFGAALHALQFINLAIHLLRKRGHALRELFDHFCDSGVLLEQFQQLQGLRRRYLRTLIGGLGQGDEEEADDNGEDEKKSRGAADGHAGGAVRIHEGGIRNTGQADGTADRRGRWGEQPAAQTQKGCGEGRRRRAGATT